MSYTVGMSRSETPREDRGSVRQSINIEMFKAMERKTSLRTILRSLQLPFVFSTASKIFDFWGRILKVNQTSLAPFHTGQAAISPWFITGFTDAEGCFSILIQQNVKYKTGWRVKAIFSIGLHKKDIAILEKIKSTFGVGKIHKQGKDAVQYRVESIKELQIIIDHFDKYSLLSAKIADYLLFKEAFNIIKLQEHLTVEGLNKLVGIKASLNLGLPLNLKEAFPKVVSFNRSEYIFKGISHPDWVAGFTSGDGSFNIKISRFTTNKIGSRVQLRFSITLNIREKELIKGLLLYFNLGYLNVPPLPSMKELGTGVQDISDKYIYVWKDTVGLQVMNFSDITDVIIPFFDKYRVHGQKSLDYEDFKKVVEICKAKDHLNSEGLKKIMDIKLGMNRSR